MPLTKQQNETMVKLRKEGKTYNEVAQLMGLNKRSMAAYIRQSKHLFYEKPTDKYFNVDLYTKTIATI